MYRTIDERFELLEKQLEKQAFQIKLMQKIIADQQQYALYDLIISANISEETFSELHTLTKRYEQKQEQLLPVTLSDFVYDFQRIIAKDETNAYPRDVSSLIPRWLGGNAGNFGFSQKLYEQFYGD
ncbi:hypothetical protein [Solibacillus sp. FSL H8-0538]|uniref:hypothetical protein n=1 Tax=Solibacillus sp. FSL H8-0538 TaxID=2921400 RepID=UPI0030F847A5